MPGPNITVTIQAASDARMTLDNSGGAALNDDDCRKMYGLPHMFMASGYMQQHDGTRVGQYAGIDTNGNKVFYGFQFIINDSKSMTSVAEGGTGRLRDPAVQTTAANKTLRWDVIDAPSWGASGWSNSAIAYGLAEEYGITGGYGAGDSSVTLLRAYISSTSTHGFPINRRPTTTAFQLNCESIQHSIQDMSTITALPGVDYGDSGMTGTPEQLDNIAIAFGMRKETISLSGILVDKGVISASNPRRQVILNIARSQYLKIRNASPIADSKEKTEGQYKPRGVQTQWGGIYAGPMNPRSYPCLTILGQGYDAADAGSAASSGVGTKGDVEADGGYRIYRGLIKSLSWTMDPGRPDFWRWKMTFETVANEKRANDLLFDAADIRGNDGEDAG